MPRYDHRHHDGLAGSGRHLGTEPLQCPAIGRDVDADSFAGRGLGKPDECLDRLELTEKEPTALELLGIGPVFQQSLGDPRHTGIAIGTPCLDPLPNSIDERNLAEHAGIVERGGVSGRHHVSRGPAALLKIEQARRPIIPPMPGRLLVGRIDDQAVDGRAGHDLASGGTSGSS